MHRNHLKFSISVILSTLGRQVVDNYLLSDKLIWVMRSEKGVVTRYRNGDGPYNSAQLMRARIARFKNQGTHA